MLGGDVPCGDRQGEAPGAKELGPPLGGTRGHHRAGLGATTGRDQGHHREGLGVTTGRDSGGKEHLNIILVCPTSHRVTQHLGVKSRQIHDREGSLLAFLMASAGDNDFIPFEQWQGQDMIIFWEINKLRCAFTTFISNLIAGHMH